MIQSRLIIRPIPKLFLVGFFCMVLGGLTVQAAPPSYLQALLDEIPQEYDPSSFFEMSDESTVLVSGSSAMQRHQWIDDAEGDFGKFVRIEVLEEGENAWDVIVHSVTNPSYLGKGDWVLASFWARASHYSDSALLTGYIERTSPSWVGIASLGGTAVGEWRRFVGAGQIEEAYAEESVKLSLHLANGIQSIDIAGVSVLYLNNKVDPDLLPGSKISYVGMGDDAPWRETARQMIEQNRTGKMRFQLVDMAGIPLEGAKVQVEQIEHAYQFGSFFSPLLLEESEEGENYRQWLKDNFNHATAPVYWADWGWANPTRKEQYKEMAAWLQQEGIPARGHVLMYPGWKFAPQELRDLSGDPAAFQARILEHFEEIVPVMKAYGIREYDVTNELRQLQEITDIVGMEGVVEWFQKVRELDPDAILYINENTILSDGGSNLAAHDHYFETIQTLIDMGAPIDGIGMQGHFTEAVTEPERIWEILDRFAVYGLPIRITEYDLTTRDEEGQASFDSDFYTALFAHPSTVGVTRWGYYEPEMWRPLGAIIDGDGVYKPNGLAQRELLFETWNTEVDLITDEQGNIELDAYFGTYRLQVEWEGKTFEVETFFDRVEEGGTFVPLPLPAEGGRVSLDSEISDNEILLEWITSAVPLVYEVWTSTDLKSWKMEKQIVDPEKKPSINWSQELESDRLFVRLKAF